MKTIHTGYNLQNITQKPEAYLSDLFILLYSIYLIDKNGANTTKLALMKLYPYIFDRLESADKLEKIAIFNLPFYKMIHGHYNRSLIDKYIKKLKEAGLLNQSGISYSLTRESQQLMNNFYKKMREDSDKLLEELIGEFSIKFLNSDNNKSFQALSYVSHRMIVDDNGVKKTVDDLEIDDNTAISYNFEDFKEGRQSDIVPDQYLTLLASQLQEKDSVNQEDLDTVEKLFPSSQ